MRRLLGACPHFLSPQMGGVLPFGQLLAPGTRLPTAVLVCVFPDGSGAVCLYTGLASEGAQLRMGFTKLPQLNKAIFSSAV